MERLLDATVVFLGLSLPEPGYNALNEFFVSSTGSKPPALSPPSHTTLKRFEHSGIGGRALVRSRPGNFRDEGRVSIGDTHRAGGSGQEVRSNGSSSIDEIGGVGRGARRGRGRRRV
jgi:hypothetical protein